MSIVLKKLGIFGVSTTSLGGAAYAVSEFAADHKPLVDIEDKSDSVKLDKPKQEGEVISNNRDGEAPRGFDVREEAPQKPVEVSLPSVDTEIKEERSEATLVPPVERAPEAPTISVLQTPETVQNEKVSTVVKEPEVVIPPAKPSVEQVPPKTPKVTESEPRPAAAKPVAKVPETPKAPSLPKASVAPEVSSQPRVTRSAEAPRAAVSEPARKTPRVRVTYKWRARYHDQEFFDRGKNGYQGKWGEKYSKYLVGTGVRRNSEAVADNIPWWNEKFLDLQEDTKVTRGKFYDLKKLNKDGGKALMKLCDAAYKADVRYITETGTGSSYYKESEVWKYCSPYGEKVHTLVDGSSLKLNNAYEHKGENRKILVTVEAGKNAWFWNLKVEEISKHTRFEANSAFGKMKKDGSLSADKIREFCRMSYSSNIKTKGTPFPKAEVYTYCSLTGRAYEG